MKDTLRKELRPLASSPRGKLLNATLSGTNTQTDLSTSIAILKSDVLLLQKRIDCMSVDQVPFTSQMQFQEQLLLSLPGAADGMNKQVLTELVLQKVNQLAQFMLQMAFNDPAAGKHQGRASTVEAFTKFVDRVGSTAFSDFRSQLSKASLEEKKDAMMAERNRSVEERLAEQAERNAQEMQHVQEEHEKNMAAMEEEAESLRAQLAALNEKGGGKDANPAAQIKELTEANRKLQEEHDRLRGLVDSFNKASELGCKIAFQGITTKKFLQMCGVDIDIPTEEEMTHPLPAQEEVHEEPPKGGKDAKGKGGDDREAKQKVQIEALTMNLNKQNQVLQDIHHQLPPLVLQKKEECERLSEEVARLQKQVEILLEDQKQSQALRSIQTSQQIAASASPEQLRPAESFNTKGSRPYGGMALALMEDDDEDVCRTPPPIVEVRNPPQPPPKKDPNESSGRSMLSKKADPNPELTAALNKIEHLEAEVKTMTEEQEVLDKRMRLCDRTVLKAEALVAEKEQSLSNMKKQLDASVEAMKLMQAQRGIEKDQYRTMEGMLKTHQRMVEDATGKVQTLEAKLVDLEKERREELRLITVKYEEASARLYHRLKELNDAKSMEIAQTLRSSHILAPIAGCLSGRNLQPSLHTPKAPTPRNTKKIH
uniref:Uncharacterized protein n=1 Tax=Eutreptiella gymnastica TaxID=73025 RepID=A0A7S1ISG0_9EUGL|mmetsp:Transcript_38427/g.68767  ORF Transcript_38427/g.68767 Transcript_38427/m.68767 type:complete len:654 (+) Transcript_38427:108-2069(+)